MTYEKFVCWEMNYGNCLPLGSIEAIRPVFMIVMGIFLMVIAWRLCKCTAGWTARLIAAGALLLGVGYAVILPLYDAGFIERISPAGRYHGSAATAVDEARAVNAALDWLRRELLRAATGGVTTERRSNVMR